MILANSEAVFCNGVQDPDIFVNNVQVWPGRGELRFYRVYMTFDPAKYTGLACKGLGWNGNPGSLTSAMIIDPSKKDTSYSYTSMTTDELNRILDTTQGGSIYCYGIAFDIDSNTFINFQWRTPGWVSMGDVKLEVYAYYERGIVLRARKTVSQTADTTFVIHDGEFD